MTRRKQAKPRSLKQSDASGSGREGMISACFSDTVLAESLCPEAEMEWISPSCSDGETVHLPASSSQILQSECLSEMSENVFYSDSEDDASSTSSSVDTRSTISDLSVRSSSPVSETSRSDKASTGTANSMPYKCNFCTRTYSRQSLMKLHEQSHTDRLPFECQFCHHRFKHKRSKDRHVKLHTGEKKFKCQLCPSAYCRSDHLKIHLRTHDKRKPYQCGVCSRGYRTAAALTSHQQRHNHTAANTPVRAPSIADTDNHSAEPTNHSAEPTNQTAASIKHSSTPTNHSAASVAELQSTTLVDKVEHDITSIKPNPCNSDQENTAVEETQKNTKSSPANHLPEEETTSKRLSLKDSPTMPAVLDFNISRLSSVQQMAPLSQSWTCLYCEHSLQFSSAESLSQHIQAHHASFLSLPPNCTPFSIQSHPLGLGSPVNPPAISPPVVCVLCGTLHASIPALVRHMRHTHHDGTKRQGDELTDSLPQTRNKKPRSEQPPGTAITPALKPSTKSPVICNVCLAGFEDFESYRVHFQRSHLESESVHMVEVGGDRSEAIVCDHCGEIFQSPARLLSHLTLVLASPVTRHHCSQCDDGRAAGFLCDAQLQMHMREKHVQVVYRCSICCHVFDTVSDMQVHLQSVHSEKSSVLECSGCSSGNSKALFADEAEFSQHIRAVHLKEVEKVTPTSLLLSSDEKSRVLASYSRLFGGLEALPLSEPEGFPAQHGLLSCRFCPLTFSVPYQLDQHVSQHHSVDTQLISNNLSLQAGCLAPISFTPHSSSPSVTPVSALGAATELSPVYPAVRHKCNICDKLLSSARHLAQHKLTHCKVVSGSCCAVCKGEITTTALFRHHMQLHSGSVFPASCAICLQTLVTEHELSLHAEFHLLHAAPQSPPPRPPPLCTEGGRLACSLCSTRLSSSSHLHVHLLEHSFAGRASFDCYICDSVFTTAIALSRHMQSHGAEARPFDCPHCRCTFFFRVELDHHMLTRCSSRSLARRHDRQRAARGQSPPEPRRIARSQSPPEHQMAAKKQFLPELKKTARGQSPPEHQKTAPDQSPPEYQKTARSSSHSPPAAEARSDRISSEDPAAADPDPIVSSNTDSHRKHTENSNHAHGEHTGSNSVGATSDSDSTHTENNDIVDVETA